MAQDPEGQDGVSQVFTTFDEVEDNLSTQQGADTDVRILM